MSSDSDHPKECESTHRVYLRKHGHNFGAIITKELIPECQRIIGWLDGVRPLFSTLAKLEEFVESGHVREVLGTTGEFEKIIHVFNCLAHLQGLYPISFGLTDTLRYTRFYHSSPAINDQYKQSVSRLLDLVNEKIAELTKETSLDAIVSAAAKEKSSEYEQLREEIRKIPAEGGLLHQEIERHCTIVSKYPSTEDMIRDMKKYLEFCESRNKIRTRIHGLKTQLISIHSRFRNIRELSFEAVEQKYVIDESMRLEDWGNELDDISRCIKGIFAEITGALAYTIMSESCIDTIRGKCLKIEALILYIDARTTFVEK